jgi:hypothetical protein
MNAEGFIGEIQAKNIFWIENVAKFAASKNTPKYSVNQYLFGYECHQEL